MGHIGETTRKPKKSDFEGKTIAYFERSADNVWRIEFTDNTRIEIWAECSDGLPFMEIEKVKSFLKRS